MAAVCSFSTAAMLLGVWVYAGPYGLHVAFRHGGTYWLSISTDSPRLSSSMRLALNEAPIAEPGELQWKGLKPGFETADLPVMVDGKAVDHIFLARIDPAHFRFETLNSSDGDKNLDQWMKHLGAALVVNGSYYARNGKPDTPFLSGGILLGPKNYDARAGAFVTSASFTGIQNLGQTTWQSAFQGATNAMVSYPLLISNGNVGAIHPSRWLANRSFVGQDRDGLIIIGTTTDAFFTLDRLAHFLADAPLGLTTALNLDGGPVASQAISLNGFERRTYGRWETETDGRQVKLLTWPYGTVALPVVLAVFPK